MPPFFKEFEKKPSTSPSPKKKKKNSSNTNEIVEVNSDDSDVIVSSSSSHKRRLAKNHSKPIVIDDRDERNDLIIIDETVGVKVKRERSDDVVFVSSKRVVVEQQPSSITTTNDVNGGNNINNIVNSNNSSGNNVQANANNSNNLVVKPVNGIQNNSSDNLGNNQVSQQPSIVVNNVTPVVTNDVSSNIVSSTTTSITAAAIIANLPKPKIEENLINTQQSNPVVNNLQKELRTNEKPVLNVNNQQVITNISNNSQVMAKIPTNFASHPQQQNNIITPIQEKPQHFQSKQNIVNNRTPSPVTNSNAKNTNNQTNSPPVNNNLTIEQITQKTLATIQTLKSRNDFSTVTCPLTRKIICNGVLASDGVVYERASILSYIAEHGSFSPLVRGCKITESSLINIEIYSKAILMIESRISIIIDLLQKSDFTKLSTLIPESYLEVINFSMELMAEAKLNTPSTPKFLEVFRRAKAKLLPQYRNMLKKQGNTEKILHTLIESYEMHKFGFICEDIESVIVSLLITNKENNGNVYHEKKVELIMDLFNICNQSLTAFMTHFNIESDFSLILDMFTVMMQQNMCKFEAISTFVIQTLTETNKGEIDDPFYKQLIFFRNQLVVCRKEMEN